jgi:hypothetical protein
MRLAMPDSVYPLNHLETGRSFAQSLFSRIPPGNPPVFR